MMATIFHVTATVLQHKIMKLLSGKLFPLQYLLTEYNSALILLLQVLRKTGLFLFTHICGNVLC